MNPVKAALACHCGDEAFQARIDRNQQVGLLTCSVGHDSLLLDSLDYWADVIQDGRPPIVRCRCKARRFTVSLEYRFRPDGDVYEVDVQLRCSACEREKQVATFEMDYSPTAALVSTPLVPCAAPWQVARRRTFTGFWRPSDVEQALRLIAAESACVYFAAWNQRPDMVSVDRLCQLVLEALATQKPYSVLASNSEVDLEPDEVRYSWKSKPLLRLSSPTAMNYRAETGYILGLLHYVEFAEQVTLQGGIVAQPAEFIELTSRVIARLQNVFVSTRGHRTLDAPDELARLAPVLGSR